MKLDGINFEYHGDMFQRVCHHDNSGHYSDGQLFIENFEIK